MIPFDPADTADGVAPEDGEPNETEDNATVMEYAEVDDTGDYFLSLAYGEWQTNGDVDGILFTVPADLNITAGSRGSASIVFPPPATDGNGSSTNPGVIVVTDTTNDTIVARFDWSEETNSVLERASMDFPVTAGTTYLITNEEGPVAADGTVPFYFLLHTVGSGNPVEAETVPLQNDTSVTAESLDPVDTAAGTSFFVEGNLADGDVDYFTFPVSDETFTVTCGSLRSGSGATGFTATVYAQNGTTALPMGSDTETVASVAIFRSST